MLQGWNPIRNFSSRRSLASYASKISPDFYTSDRGKPLIDLYRRMVRRGPNLEPMPYVPWVLLGMNVQDWFACNKFGKTVEQLRMESGTSYKAIRQLTEVHLLCERGRFSFRTPQPESDFKFKSNPDHTFVFIVGVRFGLAELDAPERAHFFDEVCPCGAREHDIDNLRKQWTRFRKGPLWGNDSPLMPPPLWHTTVGSPGRLLVQKRREGKNRHDPR